MTDDAVVAALLRAGLERPWTVVKSGFMSNFSAVG